MRIEQIGIRNDMLDVLGDAVDIGTDINPRMDLMSAADEVVFTIDLNATDAVAAASAGEASFGAPDGYANWGAVTDKDGETVAATDASYGVIYDGTGAGAEVTRLSVGTPIQNGGTVGAGGWDDSSTTALPITDTSGLAANMVLKVENEYVVISEVTNGTSIAVYARGSSGSSAASHSAGVSYSIGSGKDIEMSSLTCQQGIFTTFTATPKMTMPAGSYI